MERRATSRGAAFARRHHRRLDVGVVGADVVGVGAGVGADVGAGAAGVARCVPKRRRAA